jgi:ankyrin repeat protein
MNDMVTLTKLFEQGVNLNHGDYDNRTPLHVSCGAGHFEVVKFLVQIAKVDVNPVDRWGATPLCDAQPHPLIKQMLLENGAFLGKI